MVLDLSIANRFKNRGLSTLTALQKQLQPYRQYFDRKNNPNAIQIVVSGERPCS
jgi:alkaline phosphatase